MGPPSSTSVNLADLKEERQAGATLPKPQTQKRWVGRQTRRVQVVYTLWPVLMTSSPSSPHVISSRANPKAPGLESQDPKSPAPYEWLEANIKDKPGPEEGSNGSKATQPDKTRAPSSQTHPRTDHTSPSLPAWPQETQFQGLQLEREACLASNYALAKENLALRPRLEMGRAALAIKYQELREVAENCADKLQRLEDTMHRWSPHCALGWLQAELEEAEQEAEEHMEQLLLGEQSLEAFLPAFQRGRALAHLRRTQAEKLQELLRRRERSTQPAPTAATDAPKPFPAAAVLPTGAARGPPAVPRSLPPLDSRPVPPLKGSPGCPLGPAPLLSPRPSQPEPPHR
ncbi:Vacuolar protein sorting-associated protein 37D [Heterocephalus glaber]|uniref:Vacuolar protein sorting-associated protein 37D n=1 Tax=Heterocephalus glaber TaxID=10181 RepID=G5BG78_HETGA|nr:Vacuolar protein sorting-associated protein 37D [Heterocephalus glaber]